MQFSDLKLLPGVSLQLQLNNSIGQPERLNSRYIGAVADRSLLFSVPRAAGKIMRFRAGQKIAVRLMVANGIGLFACVVEGQITEPYPLLCVTYPETVKFKGIRSATRVAIDLPAVAMHDGALGSIQGSGKVADISTTGARLELKQAIADVGDNVRIEMSVLVAGAERTLSLEATIRSRVERSTHEQSLDYPAVYGVEFIEQNPDQLLVLYAYVYAKILDEQAPDETN
ncbi:MAG TPA: flagellar brake protein [Cellvibrionaceae bacterium]